MDKFADYMVKDLKTGECFRADHLIEGSVSILTTSLKDNVSMATIYFEIF